ncbi:HEXXH motif-containing putative peptide modification protein [Kitasatospora purpeofusca]|uniref:aKG-HExxH-type peptide beta-hydroxylase n=1 Tax=Kitasatospora purpeofusca TaxID=67352 RepID=UPI00224E5F3A|nr:HEXXH motif-containing putative peptide modification protein [Kitasatospora purpeofusca]MCX4689758.1 HEXXH motif-containing putative peptide modification protein [Kitasatospora purpeofusca]
MDAPVAFDFPPIQRLHRSRIAKIHSVTHPTTPPTPVGDAALDYCLAHHVLEGSETAARSSDSVLFDWYVANHDAGAADKLTPTAVGPRIILSPDLTDLPRSPISETPYYVLRPETVLAPLNLRSIAASAYSTAAGNGFGDLMATHAVVVCLLRTKQLGDTLDSWTITRLPGTVFLDHVGAPVVLARDLIHEAGHNWLNDALSATACQFSDDEFFYSPWKQTARPAFAFLHACWAFPLTMIYTSRVVEHTSGDLQRFLTAYLARQRELLASTVDDHARALQLITNDGLRARLQAVHHQALSL